MDLTSLYSVPLWNSEYPEFEEYKEIFLSSIKEFREKNPDGDKNRKSNIAGYQSPPTLHHVKEFRPLFEHICQMAFKACADMDFIECDVAVTSAWVNINDSRQCMNSEHVHGEVFSGVFYLQTPEGSGKLSITNPAINKMWKGCSLSSQKNNFTGETVLINPTEGDIMFFPSYLPHAVQTNDHDEERISISFNIIALPKGSIDYSSQKKTINSKNDDTKWQYTIETNMSNV